MLNCGNISPNFGVLSKVKVLNGGHGVAEGIGARWVPLQGDDCWLRCMFENLSKLLGSKDGIVHMNF